MSRWHVFRPHTEGPSTGQNFLYDSAYPEPRPLAADQVFTGCHSSHRICRVYARNGRSRRADCCRVDQLIGANRADDPTNM